MTAFHSPLILSTTSLQQTQALAQILALQLKPGMVWTLSGELGCGKTTLARAIIRALGHQGHIKSPSYTLVEGYPLQPDWQVYHFDCYRLHSAEEWILSGFDEYLTPHSSALIEWPEKIDNQAPSIDLNFQLQAHYYQKNSNHQLRLQLHAFSLLGSHLLEIFAQQPEIQAVTLYE